MAFKTIDKDGNTMQIVQDELNKQLKKLPETRGILIDNSLFDRVKTRKDVAFDFSAERFASTKTVKQGQFVLLGVTCGMLELLGRIPQIRDGDTYYDVVEQTLFIPEIAPASVLVFDINRNAPSFLDNLVEIPMFSVCVPLSVIDTRYDFDEYANPHAILDEMNVTHLGSYFNFPNDILLANKNQPVTAFIKKGGNYYFKENQENYFNRAMMICQILDKYEQEKNDKICKSYFHNLEENVKIVIQGCYCLESMDKIFKDFKNSNPNKKFEQILDLQVKCFNQNLKATKLPLADFIDKTKSNIDCFNVQYDLIMRKEDKKQEKDRKMTKIWQKVQ